MGINAIMCKGEYADLGKSESGVGKRTSSDFDRADLLKGAAMIALMAAGTFAAGCIGHSDEQAVTKTERYRFNRFGDTKTIHDESTNKTYEFEFDGLKERWSHANFYQAAHFNVYDVDSQGKNKIGDIELAPHSSLIGDDMTLPGTGIDLGVDIGKGYVDLGVTER